SNPAGHVVKRHSMLNKLTVSRCLSSSPADGCPVTLRRVLSEATFRLPKGSTPPLAEVVRQHSTSFVKTYEKRRVPLGRVSAQVACNWPCRWAASSSSSPDRHNKS